jgi:amidohydrolase
MKKNYRNITRSLWSLFIFILSMSLSSCVIASDNYRIDNNSASTIDSLAKNIETKIIEIRRDIHQHPELGNREFRTSALVARYLEELGIMVQTEVAHTGVVGILKGKNQTPVVALRADMDALPITEELDLPFASKVRTMYNGKECGVMHACGHDVHTAILMGVAEILAKMRDQIPGTVKFIFQPAEEGPPEGEEGGAKLMVKEGVLKDPVPGVVFALHTYPTEIGKLLYKPNAVLASSDALEIIVQGRGTHAGAPWNGVDPIVVASQIVLGLQTIISRQIDLTQAAAVISIGSISGGNRFNVIPDEVKISGTIRTLDEEIRSLIHERIKMTAEKIAESEGATAKVTITKDVPVTVNNEKLTKSSIPILRSVVGDSNLIEISPRTVAEDFSFFSQKVPGFYFFLGVIPPDTPIDKIEANHSPRFYVDERSIITGMRSLAYLAVGYMQSNVK